MELTLKELIINPAGKGSGDVNARYRIIDDLKKKFKTLSEKHDFFFAGYKNKEKIVFHTQVPSETLLQPFRFDVIIEANLPEKFTKQGLLASNIKIFSNIASFVYFYAYVANKEDLLVPWLEDKLPSKALKEKPRVRNPAERIGFEKSIFYASQFILQNRLFDPAVIKFSKLDYKKIYDTIETFDDNFLIYNKLKKKEALARKKNKKANKNSNNKSNKKKISSIKKIRRKPSVRSVKKV